MCNFMSVCSDGKGKVFYFDWKIRKQILKGKLKYEMDSHTSIANHFGFKGKDEDKLNKYEFNPLTKEFKKDQINATDDSEEVKKKLLKLDFKKIMPQLVIQPIINPFNIKPPKKITKEHIKLMKQWDSVGDSVWTSVWASVWASVGDSIGAYVSSYFSIDYKYDFSPTIQLWEKGLVPSFDGKTWRLHGHKGKILWEGKF